VSPPVINDLTSSKFLDLEISIGRVSVPATDDIPSQQLGKATLDHIYFCIVNGDVEKLQRVVDENSVDIGHLQLQVCTALLLL
jgi:hypothetical protein